MTDTIKLKGKDSIITIENPVNTKLLNDFKQLSDSLERIKMYEDAITKRTYREVYKDSTATIEVESEVQGYLTKQKVKYTINEREIKQKGFNLYTGVETTVTTKPVITGKLYLQRNRTIYTIGYNSEKQIIVGVGFKLL
ncbi:hypothetical protein [Galbibacter pacificus]|uniref:Uncharacterized protein n=1 Tax=Galbibacter pacificus TaxID=2996052 RepID=A0ABT6FQC6_9FLAO|nr:hypothetical protein [Galbibacter pacificus]MDG3582058.1 hypothetical protein [Galbibacter pacificus]MDG3585468.1 hypothetical protein [Galbibacter pacificus]